MKGNKKEVVKKMKAVDLVNKIQEDTKKADLVKIVEGYYEQGKWFNTLREDTHRLLNWRINSVPPLDTLGILRRGQVIMHAHNLFPVVYLYSKSSKSYTPYCAVIDQYSGAHAPVRFSLVKWSKHSGGGVCKDTGKFVRAWDIENEGEMIPVNTYVRNLVFEKEHKIDLEGKNLVDTYNYKRAMKKEFHGVFVSLGFHLGNALLDDPCGYVVIPLNSLACCDALGYITCKPKGARYWAYGRSARRKCSPDSVLDFFNASVENFELHTQSPEDFFDLESVDPMVRFPIDFYLIEEARDGKPPKVMEHYFSSILTYESVHKENLEQDDELPDATFLAYLANIYFNEAGETRIGVQGSQIQ